jgi:UDP-N-acetylmuramoyl-tripeptide--D-alanyl-D-alanine ligase
MWKLEELLDATGGTPLKVEREEFSDISTDSRTIREGEVFIPLKGARFDGHSFIREALERSRGCAFCSEDRRHLVEGLSGTIIVVKDTTKALSDLALYKRSRLSSRTVAITGSGGKTTTKDLIVHTLGALCAFNEKSYNNIIGVSKSILSIKGEPEFLVLELGTNRKGEIKELSSIVRPHISLITHIYPSHLEGLGDMEGVLEEKLDLFRGTREDGLLILNVDDPYLSSSAQMFRQKIATCSLTGKAQFRLKVLRDLSWDGFILELSCGERALRVRTSLLGTFNLYNILFAYSILSSCGIGDGRIREGIESFSAAPSRFNVLRSRRGYIVVDDTYNANPASMRYAIETVLSLPACGKRILILGDMKELGEGSSLYHRELGAFLKERRDLHVIFFGSEMRRAFEERGEGLFFEEKDGIIEHIRKLAAEGDVILVKGSRAQRMEEIVEGIV